MDWGGASFGEYRGYHRQNDGGGQAHETYVAWLNRHFGLAPPDDPNGLIDAAENEVGAQFRTWIRAFIEGA